MCWWVGWWWVDGLFAYIQDILIDSDMASVLMDKLVTEARRLCLDKLLDGGHPFEVLYMDTEVTVKAATSFELAHHHVAALVKTIGVYRGLLSQLSLEKEI